MNPDFKALLLEATGAEAAYPIEEIQSLWSGYGKIMRYGLDGADRGSVVVKHVQLPDRAHHPRGWGTDRSHRRKIRSYQVEIAWYRDWSDRCDDSCRVPQCLATYATEDEFMMVLEDLDTSGFNLRRDSVTLEEIQACLRWLANFHATFMGEAPAGLWAVGSYWHLDTRPDELLALDDQALKQAAAKIDSLLNSAIYQTFIHGDAKLANFCFSEAGGQVAAVDFQYVGGGCGMKDVAYFMGSCLYEDECERHESALLDFYFLELNSALEYRKHDINFEALEREWRALYPVAWTDFHRFVKGWSPGHWKIHGYSERLAREVVAQMESSEMN